MNNVITDADFLAQNNPGAAVLNQETAPVEAPEISDAVQQAKKGLTMFLSAMESLPLPHGVEEKVARAFGPDAMVQNVEDTQALILRNMVFQLEGYLKREAAKFVDNHMPRYRKQLQNNGWQHEDPNDTSPYESRTAQYGRRINGAQIRSEHWYQQLAEIVADVHEDITGEKIGSRQKAASPEQAAKSAQAVEALQALSMFD